MLLSCIYLCFYTVCSSCILGPLCAVLPSTSAASQKTEPSRRLEKLENAKNFSPSGTTRETVQSGSLSIPYPHYSSPPIIFLLQYSSSQATPSSPASAYSLSSRRQASLDIRPVSIVKPMSYGVVRSRRVETIAVKPKTTAHRDTHQLPSLSRDRPSSSRRSCCFPPSLCASPAWSVSQENQSRRLSRYP